MNPFPPTSQGFEFYADLGPALGELPLVPSPSNHPRSLIKELQTISLEDVLGTVVSDRLMAQAVRAGLLLVADAWNEAHEAAQDFCDPSSPGNPTVVGLLYSARDEHMNADRRPGFQNRPMA